MLRHRLHLRFRLRGGWLVRLTQPTLTGSNLKQPSLDVTLVVCIPYRCLDCQAVGTVKEGLLVQFVVSFLAEMNIVTELPPGASWRRRLRGVWAGASEELSRRPSGAGLITFN